MVGIGPVCDILFQLNHIFISHTNTPIYLSYTYKVTYFMSHITLYNLLYITYSITYPQLEEHIVVCEVVSIKEKKSNFFLSQ